MPTFTGDNQANLLVGGAGDDTLFGLGGNDTLNGGAGSDVMHGGTGDDYYIVDAAADRVIEAGGEGYDTAFTSVSFTLEAGSEVEALRASDAASVVALNLAGNEYNQILAGSAGANVLRGGGGDDYLEGRGGNDTLDGGTGNDVLRGGTGDDYYIVDAASDRVLEAGGEGYDTAFTSVSFALEAGSEVEAVRASDAASVVALNLTGNEYSQVLAGNGGANVLRGGGGDDYLEGRGGADTLDGGTGNDVLRGGIGDDYYVVDSALDRVLEAGGEGYDTAFTDVSFALEAGSAVEELRITDPAGLAAINLTGNELNQVLVGNAGANVLNGGGGNDHLEGRAGVDTLDGGSGDDVLRGGTGNDYYIVDSASDRVIEAVGEGYDTAFASGSFALEGGSAVEEFRITDAAGLAAINLTGNELNQVLVGNAGANALNGGGGDDYLEGRGGVDTLDGGAGSDVLRGGTGNDYYIIDNMSDRVIEAVGEGHDTAFASVSFALDAAAEVDELRVTDAAGVTAVNLTGNQFAQVIVGNAGANVLNGGGGDDYLEGRGGVDTLDGGAGTDVLRGGTGNDYYVVDSANDRILESAGEGYDVVFATTSFALETGAEVEELRIANADDFGPINLSGNELGQVVVGSAGANVLHGGGGNDTLYGRSGHDVLAGGDGNDAIDGADGDDRLEGGLGNDRLTGGAGNDRFVFSAAGTNTSDEISDFNVDQDRFILNGDPGSIFSGLATGILYYNNDPFGGAGVPDPSAPRFLFNSAKAAIYYDTPTGSLYFDADGAGGQPMALFARVTPGTTLRTSHFSVEGAPNQSPVITSSGSATVADRAPSSTIVYQIQAVDPDGDNLEFSIGGADRQFLTVDSAGVVRLAAEANHAARSSYDFTVHVQESNGEQVSKAVRLVVATDSGLPPYEVAEREPNNVRGEATPLDRASFRVTTNNNLANDDLPSARITGSIAAVTDKDFFSITLNSGELIILDIDGTTTLDSLVRLFDENGNELAFNDDLGSFDPGSSPHTGVAHNMDSFLKFRVPTSGTYYFSVEAFAEASGPSNPGSYTLNVSIGPRATPAQLIQEDVEALLSGSSWDTTALSFGFPTSAAQYPTGEATDERATFQPLLAAQQATVRQVLSHTSDLTNLSFTENSESPGSAQLRYGRTAEGDTAHAFYPGTGDGGDSWYNSLNGDYDNPVIGNYAWATFLHETGHSLGLKHGHESPALSPSRNSLEYSVMTYNSYVGATTGDDGGYTNEQFGYPQTFMMLDIAALQSLYGADFGFNAGNSTYSWNPASGAFSINGATQFTPGANRVFMTVWDGGGTDTYDLSNYSSTGGVQIDLRPGEWIVLSAVQRANLGDGRYAVGNVANALLFNNDPRSLIENAIGTSGSDVITGNSAVNRLTGGAGADLFRFYDVAQSSRTATDTITDFMSADRLDFSVMDANPATPSDDTFYYLHTAAFTGQPAQLRHERVGSDVMVFADIDGDGVADFQLILQNAPDLFATNFLF